MEQAIQGHWDSREEWLREGPCGHCQDVWDSERGTPVASVDDTPPDATDAVKRNLYNARRVIGKPLCSNCENKMRRRPGGHLIKFSFDQ